MDIFMRLLATIINLTVKFNLNTLFLGFKWLMLLNCTLSYLEAD